MKHVSKIISLVIFVCLAMWSIRNLKVHDVSCAFATLRLVIITTVSKGLLYSTGGPAERSIIWSIIGTITHNAYWSTHTVIDQSPGHWIRPLVWLMHQAYWPTHTVLNQSTGRWLGPSAEWNRPVLAGRTASVMAAYRPHPKFGDIDPVVSVEIIRIETDIDSSRQQTKFDKLTQPKSSRTVPSLAITSSEEEILKKASALPSPLDGFQVPK